MSTKKQTPAAKLEVEVKQSPAQAKLDIHEFIAQLTGADAEDEGEGEQPGKIWMILKLFTKGYWRTEIVAAGFNRSTVYRQTGEYTKLLKGECKTYQGFEVYEGRVQRTMKRKKMTREEAVAWIAAKDLEDND